jgi:hypothetical protein
MISFIDSIDWFLPSYKGHSPLSAKISVCLCLLGSALSIFLSPIGSFYIHGLLISILFAFRSGVFGTRASELLVVVTCIGGAVTSHIRFDELFPHNNTFHNLQYVRIGSNMWIGILCLSGGPALATNLFAVLYPLYCYQSSPLRERK